MSHGASEVVYEEVVCNLCGTDDSDLRFPDTRAEAQDRSLSWSALCCTSSGYGIHPPIVECRCCGLVYANPQPRAEDLQDQYASVEDPLYVEERRGRELTFQRHLTEFEKETGLGAEDRILDIGAYIGIFVEVAERAGWRASGLEPSRWAAAHGQARGLDIRCGSLDDELFDPGSFDAVTLWDVIEHVSDPARILKQAHDLLEPGGWIAVHTMDLDSLFARITGRRWPWLMEMHLYYFSRRTLIAMLEQAGFENVSLKAQGRYLRISYLITRIRRISPFLAGVAERVAKSTGLDRVAIPINFGDLVTAYARRPKTA